MKILVTGSAGFIGSNLVERLLATESGVEIVGLDSVNDYYDVRLKEYRLNRLAEIAENTTANKYAFVKGNLADKALISNLFAENDFEFVCLYDCGNRWHSSFVPVYRCGGMEYYVLGGKINVVG